MWLQVTDHKTSFKTHINGGLESVLLLSCFRYRTAVRGDLWQQRLPVWLPIATLQGQISKDQGDTPLFQASTSTHLESAFSSAIWRLQSFYLMKEKSCILLADELRGREVIS